MVYNVSVAIVVIVAVVMVVGVVVVNVIVALAVVVDLAVLKVSNSAAVGEDGHMTKGSDFPEMSNCSGGSSFRKDPRPRPTAIGELVVGGSGLLMFPSGGECAPSFNCSCSVWFRIECPEVPVHFDCHVDTFTLTLWIG